MIEDNIGKKVEMVKKEVEKIYKGVRSGDIDEMMMEWIKEKNED